jgi:hypothetical protein
MVRCSGGVGDRKGSWSRDSASSDFHMYVRNGLIFCRYATARPWSTALGPVRTVNLLAPKWSRFAAQWRADPTEMADGSSTHGMTEPEMTEHGELWMGQLNPRGDGDLGPRWTSVDGPIDGFLGVGISI